MNSYSQSYKDAGVDVVAGYESVKLMREHVGRTRIPGVLSSIGGFAGLFELGRGYDNPVLVSGTDGVGTKLKLAFLMDKHDTIGIDCVAMCANDIACGGARPLMFLDYIALDKNVPEKVAMIVKGVADGCVDAGCALVGGETAEMPGFYHEGEYDLAGFCTGVVEKDKIIDGSGVDVGDALIGIASSGVHSNGFSLIRKVFGVGSGGDLSRHLDECGHTLGEELLTPTRIYVKPLLTLMESVSVKAACHITGGGFYENVPRVMKDGLTASIDKSSIPRKPIFDIIRREGAIDERDMYNTFNMGAGMILCVGADAADEAVRVLNTCGVTAFIAGEVVTGADKVVLR